MIPFPHQIEGAKFLASRRSALLADEPRVGKTGSAIMAADDNMEERVLVITTASGRPVWKRAFSDWSLYGRKVKMVLTATDRVENDDAAVIVGWGMIHDPKARSTLLSRKWDRLISDEDHFAKSFTARRTRALYGEPCPHGVYLETTHSLAEAAENKVWCLSGTPQPHDPGDWYPRLRALRPECLAAHDGMPDVIALEDFMTRYTVRRPKRLSQWNTIMVVIGGRNLDELRRRIGDFMLRRTQEEVGIRPPAYETMPLMAAAKVLKEMAALGVDEKIVLKAAHDGDTRSLDMHLGPLRRLTGAVKARLVAQAVKEEFECGLDKIVLAYWHKDVRDILAEELRSFGLAGIDGETSPKDRQEAVSKFQSDPGTRVFLAQIQAAGEAIDLSACAAMIFVETSFQPAQMRQMSLRITNINQKRQTAVRVAALEGSVDEALQAILMRLWAAIRGVIG